MQSLCFENVLSRGSSVELRSAFGLKQLMIIACAIALWMSIGSKAETFTDSGFASELITTLPPYGPVGVTWAPDGRMFIWTKNGVVRIYKNGALLATPFLDFSATINTYNDNGMLGLAFDPSFASNNYIYITYIHEPNGNPNDTSSKFARLVRVSADPANPDRMLPGSELIMFGNFPVDYGSHALGTIRFAKDATMFFAFGDGGDPASTDPNAAGAQDLNSVRGKMYRINRDGSAPADNPFYDGTSSMRSKIWCYGVRNPYRFSLHPDTGIPYVADVGWNTWEEIDRAVRGGNFGWPCYEGNDPQPLYQGLLSQCAQITSVIPPIISYNHSTGDLGQGGTCLVGGDFYTGTIYPQQYQGNYFYADYSGGWIHRIVLDSSGLPTSTASFASGASSITCLEQGPDGLFYYVSLETGEIRRIKYNGPVAVASADATSGYSPLTVSFSSAGSTNPGGGSLTYSWNFGDGATSTLPNPAHTYSGSGVRTFVATLTVKNSQNLSSSSSLKITLGSTAPTATISSPSDGSAFMPGQTVTFQGSGNDPDDGPLASSSLNWRVLLHHNDTHVHNVANMTGSEGSFVIENHGSIGTFYYEIILTAVDSSGLSSSKSISVQVQADSVSPSAPAALVANSGAVRQISLSWVASTDNAAVSGYVVERQASSESAFTQIATVPTTTFIDSGLADNSSYSYRVRAVDASGNVSSYSNAAIGATPPVTTYINSYTNPAAITIPSLGNGTPYPSSINVSGIAGVVSNVTVTLRNLTHTYPADIDILLVSPAGKKVVIFSDVGGGNPLNNITVTLSDAASSSLSATAKITAGTYRPTNVEPGENGDLDNFPSPAPGGPSSAPLSAFNGDSPNGAWSLYVVDDGPGDLGSIGSGWSLTITTVQSAAAAPVISDIPDQIRTVDASIVSVPFSVTDADTSAGSLTVSATSSNSALVPNENIALGGSGNNRTITVTPISGQIGSSTITVSVSDGILSASEPFSVMIIPPNTPPSISDIQDQATNEDVSAGPIPFTVDDGETAPGTLSLSAVSSNPGLVPNSSVVFGGSGRDRILTITPAPNQFGNTTITVTVNDGLATASDSFVFTVNPVNDPPSISLIPDQTLSVSTAGPPAPFTIADVDSPLGSLALAASSSNPALVADANIIFAGSGANQSVMITPSPGQTGVAIITVTVSDGQLSASTTFKVTITAQPSGLIAAYNFNEGSGTILTDISGHGLNGTINNATWTTGGKYGAALSFNGSSSYVDLGNSAALQISGTMTWSAWIKAAANPADDGQIISKSDGSAGWQFKTSPDTGPHTFGASVGTSGSSSAQRYSSTTRSLNTWYFVAGVYNAAAGTLDIYVNGVLNNGVLRGTIPATQFVPANVNANIGRRSGGFYFNGVIDEVRIYNRALSATEIQTDMNTPVSATPNSPPTISDIPDQVLNEDSSTGVLNFTVGDAETAVGSLTLTANSSNTALVPNANITLGGSGANRTIAVTPAPNQSGSATITVTVSDGSSTASDTFVLTVSPVDDPPTITDIPDQFTSINTPLGPISFTLADIDTTASSLSLSGNSSNPTLVPDVNIVFGGTGANRSVTVTPAPGQTGAATITVTVSDGVLMASDTFVVTVSPANTPPSISDIPDQIINEDNATAALNFSIGDAETAPASLALTKGSSNTALVPSANIVLGGSGANRTVTVTPATNQSGTATITVTVSDGQMTASDSFVVIVSPVNDPPTISNISDQSTSLGTAVGPISFTVGDIETAVISLTLSGSSSNPTLVPNSNVVFGGSGANRTVTVTPAAGQSGSAVITVTVSDGSLTSNDTFNLTVTSGIIGTRSFTNSSAITIPTVGKASPYPSAITVSGMAGTVSSMTVTLRGITHNYPADIDVLLASPTGQKAVIFSDVGGGNSLNNVTVSLADTAASSLSATARITAGTYKPTNIEPGEHGELDSFPAPAPTGPYSSPLSQFAGIDPNGIWSLYVVDDWASRQGRFSSGWVLSITTTTGSLSAQSINILRSGITLSVDHYDSEQIVLRVQGLPERQCTIEASDDLVHWSTIAMLENPGGLNLFTEQSGKMRFYRAVQVP